MSGERARAEITVTGRVQGVFYRASARDEGERLGLHGEVRNLPDGSVELVAEGERAVLEELIAWCRRGPPLAQVEEVQVRWLPATGGLSGFRVTR
ncbi:MAG TPA: acylphosphatase [Myxococcales bacterium]|jgi:acylphosphatase|nr:acylphosphatase [Myxococcales bacterium]